MLGKEEGEEGLSLGIERSSVPRYSSTKGALGHGGGRGHGGVTRKEQGLTGEEDLMRTEASRLVTVVGRAGWWWRHGLARVWRHARWCSWLETRDTGKDGLGRVELIGGPRRWHGGMA